MAFKERLELIKKIQELRGSKVVTYFMGDRRTFPPGFPLPALSTQLSSEAQPFLYEQLRLLGKNENLDLFLYTRGGQTDSVWPLVNIFREYALKRFSILVPFFAHSAGTLICLGADDIVMTEAAQLSPVDPTTGNQFNPLDEVDKATRRGISVEDVTSYIELARDPLKSQSNDAKSPNDEAWIRILEAFKRLSEEVHPIALGNVNRAHTQIRILAEKLLGLHLQSEDDEKRIKHIVDYLTKSLYSHSHAINRKEARSVFGDDLVKETTEEEQSAVWGLYALYADELKLSETFCHDQFVASITAPKELTINGGFIESERSSMIYGAHCVLRPVPQIPPGVQVQIPPGQPLPLIPGLPTTVNISVLSIGWQNNREGV